MRCPAATPPNSLFHTVGLPLRDWLHADVIIAPLRVGLGVVVTGHIGSLNQKVLGTITRRDAVLLSVEHEVDAFARCFTFLLFSNKTTITTKALLNEVIHHVLDARKGSTRL